VPPKPKAENAGVVKNILLIINHTTTKRDIIWIGLIQYDDYGTDEANLRFIVDKINTGSWDLIKK
jgi:hypothetical protein